MRCGIRSVKCVFFLLIALLASGCAREITLNLPDESPKLVAICHFNPTEPFRVNLSSSLAVYSNAKPEIFETADVSISKNGLFIDKLYRAFTPQGDLYWESRDTAIPGQRYSMVVRVPNYPTIQSSSEAPAPLALEPISLSAKEIDTIKYNESRYELRIPLKLQVRNLPGTHRFFAFKLSHEIGVYDFGETPAELLFTSTSDSTYFLADGRTLSLLYNIAEPAVLINENFWNEDRTTLSLIVRIDFNPQSERPRQLFIEWRTLSEAFYRYHLSIARQGSSIPLSEPDAVYDNVEGGYGNFSGFSSKFYTVELAK
ncbi:MAG: DUF4249 family protein [Bacteroidetes bacterium]|nr:DUF4249 family protein [Bacteroidota bacterium]